MPSKAPSKTKETKSTSRKASTGMVVGSARVVEAETKPLQVFLQSGKHQALESISREKGISLAEMTRRIIDFYLTLRPEMKEGYKLVLEGEEDKYIIITPDIW